MSTCATYRGKASSSTFFGAGAVATLLASSYAVSESDCLGERISRRNTAPKKKYIIVAAPDMEDLAEDLVKACPQHFEFYKTSWVRIRVLYRTLYSMHLSY
jgi:hypothetical protein